MVIDTSAVVAIILNEPERKGFLELIRTADVRLMSAATFVEAAMVIEASLGEAGAREFETVLQDLQTTIVNVNREQAEAARTAWRNYGKGRHRARLNFGDCFVYGLAKVTGQPILCKGNDFALTDMPVVSRVP
jgi:ribonuclease VapC